MLETSGISKCTFLITKNDPLPMAMAQARSSAV